jgi:CzcA family heavy metal efflux pump
MLNQIIKFSLANRLFILVASVILFVAGIFVANRMEVDVFPDLNAPRVVVMTEASGMAPEEIERLVTFPIESALNGATDVRRVRSSSTTGFSVVWVEFDWGTDIFKARQIVSEKLASIGASLPPQAGTPTLGPQSSILGEVMIVGMTADSTSLLDLRTYADWVLRPRLLATGGVAQVTVLGGEIKEFQLLLDIAKMRYFDVSLDEVSAAVQGLTQNESGGILYENGQEYIVRGVVATSDTALLGQAFIKMREDAPVLLEQIARVQVGAKAPKIGIASEKGKPAVLLTITKQPSVSTMDLTEQLDLAIEELKTQMPADVNISTDAFRQSRFIKASIDNVKSSLYEGCFFVIIVLFLFLMNVRTTLISLLAIPLSLLTSILTLKALGLTINTMSLGGMAIAIGSLVDDAIVDVENVFRHLRANQNKPLSERIPLKTLVFEASKEVRMPILNSTLIIVASFLPLFFLSGMEGRMLVPLGISFIVSLFASTVIALTLTPVLCTYLLKNEAKKESISKEPWVARKLKSGYAKILEKVMAWPKAIIGLSFVLFVGCLFVFFGFGRSFLPAFNEGSFTINVSTMPGVSLEESDRIGQRAEEIILSSPEIYTTVRKTGRAELDEHALGVNVSEIEAPFVLKDRDKDALANELRERLAVLPGVNLEIGQPISHRIDAMLSGAKASIAIKVFGNDLQQLYAVGQEIQQVIQPIEGLVDVNLEQQIERPQLTIVPNRMLLARYGITIAEFNEMIRVMLSGEVVSQVYDQGRTFDLTLKVDPEARMQMQQLQDLTLDAGGLKIPLSAVATIESKAGPNTISRENVQRVLTLSANTSGRDLRSVVNEIQQKVNEGVSMPEGYHITYGGQFESEAAASKTLLMTSFLAVLIIFLLLYMQFQNTKQAIVILVNLPLALMGGILVIALTSGIVSIPAIIGFISLFGIATRNGLLLIDHYNQLMASGMPVEQAIIQGSLDRLNPILMMAISTGLALIPLALKADISGNEIQSPMAQVILGGLLTSTFLNMIVVPILFRWISVPKKEAYV